MHGLFITATDTGAGKTYLTAAIAQMWRRQGRRFRVCKPVATGARWCSGALESDDARRLAEAAGEADPAQVTPWVFMAPAAPPVAARLAGVRLNFLDVVDYVHGRSGEGNAILVEGVGGLLCPLTEEKTVADLALVLKLPVVLVARRSLGTLNHTLLTLEAIRQRGLPLAGVVLSETAPPAGPAERSNAIELRRRGVPILTVLPYRPSLGTGETLGGEELEAVDWWSLGQAGTGQEMAEGAG
jgi:dethiobiotin synthetase